MPSDAPVLRLRVFPADHGDCLWIEFGTTNDVHHMLVDAGTDRCGKRLLKYIKDERRGEVHFDVFVVTHIDADHIGGALRLLDATDVKVSFGDIWFNGYAHLIPETVDAMGGVQGERLTTLLLEKRLPWNVAFDGKAVRLTSDGAVQRADLANGASATVISANQEQLLRVEKSWKDDCRKAGLDPRSPKPKQVAPDGYEAFGAPNVATLAASKFEEDTAPSNGSSIGLVFEYAQKRIVLLADAYPSVVLRGLDAMQPGVKFAADVVKLPHHGSKGNVSRELVERFATTSWVVSTSGAIFRHPDREAIARAIEYSQSPHLYFNYRSDFNGIWDNAGLKKKHGYTTDYGDGKKPQTIVIL